MCDGRRKRECLHVADIILHLASKVPFVLTNWNLVYSSLSANANRRVSRVVVAVRYFTLCTHTCPEKLHASPTRSFSSIQSQVSSINSFCFVFCVVCSLDEPSVQEFEAVINKVFLFVFTLFLLEVSSFLFDCTSRRAQLFADEKCKWELILFILLKSVEQCFSVTKQNYATFVTW